MTTLSKAQTAVLNDIRSMPARYRHQNRVDAPVKWSAVEHFDNRTLASLFSRGLIVATEYGVRISA